MAYNVITVTRQFGSLGRKIAKKVAENLGYEYYDRDIIELAVREMRGDIEKLSAFDGQLASPFDKMMYPLGKGNSNMKRALFEMEKSVMVDLATSRNCVIVGRCSDYVLRECGIPKENMLNVFIYAPIEKRLTNCKEELNLEDPGEAYTYLTRIDKAREDFYKHYTRHRFFSTKYRHLLIDSSMAADFGSFGKNVIIFSKQLKQDERKSDKKNGDGSNVCSFGNHTSNGVSHDSKCRQYFSADAYSSIDMRSPLWMAVWSVMRDFSACIIQFAYRNATGCNPSGNAQ